MSNLGQIEEGMKNLIKENERLTAGLHVESKLRQQYHIERDELQADNERLIAALRYIDDEAHDLNAAEECAREALAALETNDE